MEAQTIRSMFSNNLITFRKMRGLSQHELADKSGLSQRMIAYYETQVSNPPINNVVALSKALGITVAELIGETLNKSDSLYTGIDPRTLRKIMQIATLPPSDRATIYNTLDALIRKYPQQEPDT